MRSATWEASTAARAMAVFWAAICSFCSWISVRSAQKEMEPRSVPSRSKNGVVLTSMCRFFPDGVR